MRFLTALSVGLLASQARVAEAIKAYTLSTTLSCSTGTDTVHFDYSLGNLEIPPNFPGTDIYEASYRLTYTQNNAIVSVPVQTVAAKDGTGRSEIEQTTSVNNDNKNSAPSQGTILHHQQVNGVNVVQGYFELTTAAAANAAITCTGSTPNIQLVPLTYSVNGIDNLVLNSYDIQTSTYASVVGGAATAANPVYSFDIQPTGSIDSCYVDPNTGNTRVPFKVSGLAVAGPTEKGIVSLVVTDTNGDLVSSWSLSDTDGMFIGQGNRDPAEPSMIQVTQPSGPTEVFGRIDFAPGAAAATANCTANGQSSIRFEVVDYSTVDTVSGVQTWHYIPGSTNNNGLDPASQIPASPDQLVIAAAGTTPTKGPTAPPPSKSKCAARKAAAAKAAAKAKAAADAAKAAAAAAAAAPVPGTDTPCLLTVPANPLTAQGLATPYILGGGCTMTDTAGFVQAAILNPTTGQIQVYNPLVIQQGKKALIAPVIPNLPAGAVVALWFGSNANLQMLQGAQANTLQNANCVNGAMVNGKLSIFGQIAACNAPAFFQAAAISVFQGLTVVPPLGTAIDQQPCPTTRSFFLVDQDPADNLATQYLLDGNGNTALNTPGNLAKLTAAAAAAKQAPPTVLNNPGDNPLLNRFVNPTMKCNSWMVNDLSAPGTMNFAQATNEISAAFKQGSPVARQPALNPMGTANGAANLGKLNALRSMIGEAPVQSLNQANTATFCKNLVGTNGAVRLLGTQKVLALAAGPMAGQNLFQFLQTRFAAAVGPCNLMCGKLVPGLTNPLAGGAVIAAQSAFTVASALLVGSDAPDNAQMDPYAELQGSTPITDPTQQTQGGNQGAPASGSSGSSFPIAIVAGAVGGVIVLLVASMIIFKVVQRRKTNAVMTTTARECKV
jgi:hypothetical protein